MTDITEPVHIGHYEITAFEDGSLWIKDAGGEGMSVPDKSELMKNLENLIHMFFSEHF